MEQRLTLSVPAAAEELGISERKLRQMIAAGRFPVVRIDTRVLVVRAQLEAWLSERAAAVAV